MRHVLGVRHPSVAHLEHVRIVPCVRARVFLEADLLVEDREHRLPGVADVARRPPELAAHKTSPLPGLVLTPLAKAEHDRPARRGERVAHRLVALDGRAQLVVAVVVFEIVDAPPGERRRVRHLVVDTRRSLLARHGAGRRVDADLEALGVDVVGQPLHAVRKTRRVGRQVAQRVSRRRFPTVVDVDVLVAGVAHARRHHCVGRLANEILVDAATELVPAVPAHRRRRGEPARRARGGGRCPRGATPRHRRRQNGENEPPARCRSHARSSFEDVFRVPPSAVQ